MFIRTPLPHKKKMMDAPRTLLLGTIIVLGLTVLLSYYICFTRLSAPHPYHTHPFWYDMHPSHIKVCIVFQVLAALGFLLVCTYLLQHPPSERTGLFGYLQGYATFLLILVFLLGSIAWPFLTVYKYATASVVSLLCVAMSSIGLLAGCTEARSPAWALLGALAVCIVTVLQDGVMWNAMYIRSRRRSAD